MQCPQCQHENAADARFCNQCTTLCVPVCPACRRENAADAKFCNQCGTPYIASASVRHAVQGISPFTDAESRFQALLLAVSGLLQGKRRVTYRTLTYVFGLDAALLADVRAELLFTGVARGEAGPRFGLVRRNTHHLRTGGGYSKAICHRRGHSGPVCRDACSVATCFSNCYPNQRANRILRGCTNRRPPGRDGRCHRAYP
jgi:hypothetical protein